MSELKKLWPKALASGIVAVALLMIVLGYRSTWNLWGVPAAEPAFLDMRVVTAASESLALGFDPTAANVRDPLKREFNYPKTWLPILRLGLRDRHTVPLALLTLMLFFGSVGRLAHTPDKSTVAAIAAVTFSPALMLGYERGNLDLLFFTMLMYSILWLEQWPLLSWVLVSVGTLFKIFPVFAILLFLENRRQFLYIIALVVLFSAFVVVDWSDLQRTFAVTPKGGDSSYGMYVISRFAAAKPGWNQDLIRLATTCAASIVLALGFVSGLTAARMDTLEPGELRGFRVGASIYVGTFLLGNNWDYRLMFLLLAAPALVRWSRLASLTSCVTLAALLISCWHFVLRRFLSLIHPDLGFWVDELANWTLFGGLTFLIVASLPTWILTSSKLVSTRVHN